jgi:hypothetical protein
VATIWELALLLFAFQRLANREPGRWETHPESQRGVCVAALKFVGMVLNSGPLGGLLQESKTFVPSGSNFSLGKMVLAGGGI